MIRVLFLFLISVSCLPLPAQKVVLPIKRDDFLYRRGWWDYHRDGTVAQDTAAIQIRRGYLYLQLKDPVDSVMCNVGISDHQGVYKKGLRWLIFEARVRVLNPMKPGSRGWGFWRMTVPGKPSSLAWFMEQLGIGGDASRYTFWKAGVVHLDQRLDVDVGADPQEWHHYKVVRDMEKRTTRFYLDGREILVARGIVPRERLSLHLWIDNMIYARIFGARMAGWKGVSAMVVDYVQVRTFAEEQRYFDPQPLVPFRVQPLTMPMGHENGLWKTYEFQSRGGPSLVLTTARAEAYDFYSPPDYLKLDIQAGQQSWQGSWNWQGLELQGKARTEMREVDLPAGSVRLLLETRTTPQVGDITVLQLRKGRLLVNEAIDASPPKKADSLFWKAYRFVTEDGWLVIYLSGTARENPRWNPIRKQDRREANDDDLWLELNGRKLAPNNAYDFCGNTHLGQDRAVVYSLKVRKGEHHLRIFTHGQPRVYRLVIAQ